MIIDTHVHIGKMLTFQMPEEMVIESMNKYGIDYALISNIDSTELDFDQKEIPRELQINQVDSLERSIQFARAYPDRIGVLAWMKPYGETVTQELVDLLEKNRDIIYGLKFHPYHSKTAMDDPKVAPYLELARRFHFPVAAHTGGCEEAEPVHVRNAAEKYPDIDFVMVHMGLGSDNWEAIRFLGTLPNLYGDTTWVPLESTVLAVETAGSEKMLFGSDNPIDGLDTYYCNPKGETSVYQAYFHELEGRIGTESYQNIMYRNAVRLFHLPF
ncbi:MAG: amidohydrolase family protein [Roseburia sp.]|nr:amidohydrolase family protein [Roseburia sp.]